MTDREKTNEYEGFTIVDEFLGVREASDGSDDELDFQVEAVSKTSSSCRHPHSRTLPTSASIDIPAAHRRVGLKSRAESTTSNGCEECEDKATGAKPDELDEISTKLNKEDGGEVAFFGAVNLSIGMSSPKEDYWYARDLHPSVPLMGRARKNLQNTTLPENLPSNSVGHAIKEAKPPTKAEAGTSRTRQVMVSPVITPPTDEHPSGSASGFCQTGTENQERRSSTTKALTVRLLPGDFTFGVVVPRDGTSVSDLESEMQRELGLRDRVGLTIVEVCTIADIADDRHSSLPDAPDRCTVTARPVDRVLVRARVYRQSGAVENTPEAASTAAASATPSPWDHFIQLPLRSTWSEAMNTVKSELGVPANRHAEVRRLVRTDALESIYNDAQHGSVDDLLNGDALELRVLEVDASMDSIDGARSLAQDAKAPHKKEVVTGTVDFDPIPALVWPQLPPGALGAVAGASLSTGTLPDASRWNRWSHVEHPRAGNTRRGTRSSFGGEITPAVAPPPRAVFGSASARIAVGPPPHSRLSSASAVPPFELTPQPGAATTLALPPLSPLTSSSHFPPGAPAVRVDSSPTSPSGARPSNIGTHDWSREKKPDQLKEGPSIISADDEAAVSELVGMGFDRQHVVKALRECGRGDCWKEKAISLLLEPQMSGVEVPESTQGVGLKRHKGQASQGLVGLVCPYRCPICLSDIPAEEMFMVDCKDQHAFCVDCLYQHCSVQLLDSVIPACPLSNTTCGHELGQEDVERVFLLRTYSAAVGSSARDPTDQMEKDQRALETCRTLLTRRGLQSTGAVPCVSAQCGNWMVPEESGQRVRCGACLVDFCLSCKRSPYHYTADCDDVVRLTREWSWWLTEGKAAFLRTMAAQDDQHKSLLRQHEGKKKDHQRAVQEAERLRAEYDKMEDWKERKCRRCPVCDRVIEKVSGCDIMLCGRDAHGGNVQNGCGARFFWSMAPPYIGDRGVRKETPFTEREPKAAARSRYFIAPSIPLRCDRCHRDVVGPLFRCIHCPSFMCCLECQDMACRDPRHVHHIFQIMDTDTMAASSTANASASFSAALAVERGGRRGAYGMAVDIDDVDVV